MAHPTGAQAWGVQLGHRPEDAWRGFVALEGYPVKRFEEVSPEPAIAEPYARDVVVSTLENVEAWSALMAGRPLSSGYLDQGEVETLLRMSRDEQPDSFGYWILGRIWRIQRELERTQGREEEPEGPIAKRDRGQANLIKKERARAVSRLEELLATLMKVRRNLAAQRTKKETKFARRNDQGHTGHDVVFAERFARLVGKMNVKVVVLTTCRGSVRGVSRWSGLAAALLRAGVPVVVGMQYAISVDAAKRFSDGFYDALWEEKSIDEAVFKGRERLSRNRAEEALDDFGVPVIYSRLPDNVSLRLPDIHASK